MYRKTIRTLARTYIKSEWETARHDCTSYGKMYVTQERRKFLGLIPYWKTINIVYE